MKSLNQTIFVFLLVVCNLGAKAQRTTEIGFTGGVARFYPHVEFFENPINNNSVGNGLGFSVGVFYEYDLFSRFHPILETKYLSTSVNNIYLESGLVFNESAGYGYKAAVAENFGDKIFHYLQFSLGAKLFLNKKLFFYPAFGFSKSLDESVDLYALTYYSKDWEYVHITDRYLKKIFYHTSLAFGADFKAFDVMLEYVYGLTYHLSFFDYSVPLGINHRNNYLQLKINVPLFKLN
ncbi:hypothetical protein [Maribellus maritimus]|uniref:hypothetical protein n=1 Tax=Maribellus maritimus TaxID=2870838 RepID=UPI001EECA54E|nr:hypothetical protein [Maribellus maritimus]MCG6188193.1 hypothetical protein [Maribellus maritimus]